MTESPQVALRARQMYADGNQVCAILSGTEFNLEQLKRALNEVSFNCPPDRLDALVLPVTALSFGARPGPRGLSKNSFSIEPVPARSSRQYHEEMKEVKRLSTETLKREITKQVPCLYSPSQTTGRCSEKTDAIA